MKQAEPPTNYHIPRSMAPHEVFPDELAQARLTLAAYLPHHLPLVERFLSAADATLYYTDLFLAGAAQRSYHLLQGFLATWDSWNITAAAPILRMQIDTLIRTWYTATSPNSEETIKSLISEDSFRRLKDADGKRLTDRALVDHAAEQFPWLPPVYEKTNEWVHFSTRHIYNTWKAELRSPDDPEAVFSLRGSIPMSPGDIPTELLGELLAAMKETTEAIFGLMELWESRKGLPLGQARHLES